MAADHAMSEAVRAAYRRGEEEESMEPLVRVGPDGRPVGRVRAGDTVVFYDIRGEREVELTQAFVDPAFRAFEPAITPGSVRFVTMIEYDRSLPVAVAFPPLERLTGTLAETVSRAGLAQVKITETEKSIHLAYFLNGKRDGILPGETRIAPHSPADPFKEPAMRAADIAAEIARAAADPHVALISSNVPNMDVVGHGEDHGPVMVAIEAADRALGAALAACRTHGVTVVVTADHGTVEKRFYPEGTIDTGHTDSPVPCVVVCPDLPAGRTMRAAGSLVDVAPTVLDLMGLDKPAEMTGTSLLSGAPDGRRRRVLLFVCDGWGLAPAGPGNLISQADTPHMDALLAGTHVATLEAAGPAVGLPPGTVGNSESGHLHIGAGRVVPADRLRIARAVEDGSFYENEAFTTAIRRCVAENRPVHMLGIVSFFSSHGSIDHLFALLETAKRCGARDVFIHGLLGRRGERPESGAHYVRQVEERAAELGVGQVVSIIGRHWALDREKHWDRVEKAYRLMTEGRGRPVD